MSAPQKKLLYKGKYRTAKQWISILNLNIDVRMVLQRIRANDWSVHKALTTPIERRPNKAKPQPGCESVDNGIESYHYMMRRYFTRGFRRLQYKNLKRDYIIFKSQKISVAA